MEVGNHPWNLKQGAPSGLMKKEYLGFHGMKISPMEFGNIHFGFTGTALFLPDSFLDFLSGLANMAHGYQAFALPEGICNEFTDERYIDRGAALYPIVGPRHTIDVRRGRLGWRVDDPVNLMGIVAYAVLAASAAVLAGLDSLRLLRRRWTRAQSPQ